MHCAASYGLELRTVATEGSLELRAYLFPHLPPIDSSLLLSYLTDFTMSGISLSRLRGIFTQTLTSSANANYTPLPSTSRPSSPAPPPYSSTLPFVVLGMSVLLAWNVLISLFPHFISLVTPTSPSTALSLPSSLSLVATATNFISLSLITFRSSASSNQPKQRADPNSAIRFGLWALVGLHAALVLALLLVGKDVAEGGVKWILAGLGVWTVGVMWSGSYLQAGVMECAALFGPKEIGAVQQGQGLVALSVSLFDASLRILEPISLPILPSQVSAVQVISSVAATSTPKPRKPSSPPSPHDAGDTFSSTLLFVSAGTLFLLCESQCLPFPLRYIVNESLLQSPSTLTPPSLGGPSASSSRLPLL